MSHKVAFITGSAKRLGACIAKHLHAQGFNLVLHCRDSLEQAQKLSNQFNQHRNQSAVCLQADLCKPDQLKGLADKAESAFGRLDLLINNASSFYPTPVGSITVDDWHSLVGSNMQAPLFLAQYCAPSLKKNNGCIINMVDIHGQRPLHLHSLYCMAKSALITMTQALAQDLAPEVRVNGIAPGAILWPEQKFDEAAKEEVLNQIPAGRLGRPEDIAEAALYLASAQYVTGQIIAVDGGRSISSFSKA